MSSGEHGAVLRPGWGRPELVQALSACVAEWERVATSPVLHLDAALLGLAQRCEQLAEPSRSVGFGGAGYHLVELARLARAGAPVTAVRQQLGVARELVESAKSSLSAAEQATLRQSFAPAAAPASLAPPPMLSGYYKPPNVAEPARAPTPAPPAAPAPSGPELPRMITSFGQQPAAPSAAPMPSPSAPPAPAQRPLPAAVSSPAQPPGASPPMLGSHAPAPVPPSRPQQPNLFVRSVLGLRAFGRKPEPTGPASPSGSGPAPAPPPASLLSLGHRSSGPSQPPQALGGGYGGLPALRDPSGSFNPAERSGLSGGAAGGGRPPSGSNRPPGGSNRPSGGSLPRASSDRRLQQQTPAPLSSTPARGRPRVGSGRVRHRPGEGENRWWIGALAALGGCVVVLGIVLIGVTLSRRNDSSSVVAPVGSGAAAAASDPSAAAPGTSGMPRSKLLTEDERFRSLLAQVHGKGGKESAELRNLFDEQAAIAAQALQPGCVGPQCAALKELGKLVTNTNKKRVKRRSQTPDAMRSRWLAGLEMPEIAVEDDPRVQKRFEFYTENPLGRETFQQMLFRCGAYKDAIQSSLIRRGLPKDLIAVAYAESGCNPLAKSPVGAEGLWQFIPDAARAYHLRIIEDIVDERHSPQKSTEAAIQYYSDLYAKFGSWDLAFSAYNMGPFGLATRLAQVQGDDVGFWELVDAEMLPGETADYAPGIQAIALILNNLQKLKFGTIQQRAPQITMDLPVPPGTRLTLVARAAAMSMDELRRLNLDIKGTSTPSVPNFAVQVPKDSVWQARDTLAELLRAKDESDLCAPPNFDWGRQRFTPEMQEACARSLGARPAASVVAPSPAH